MEKKRPDEFTATACVSYRALPSEADVVIIGAGIMRAAAYYLSKRGVKAVVLDKSRLAGQQSTRAPFLLWRV